MLYVLDEAEHRPAPKDNVKMIATLESLRDIGNTVIGSGAMTRIPSAPPTIIVEMGPGPGVHGGEVVVRDYRRCAEV